ncbi:MULTISPECIES: M15 family metallopeptidase [unclassified Granulicatella]|uniref:M15 family metallopeptidase n=1 Tax=unclassified Granulicatella TaxID=2630493 RepID=UPI0010733736|nr:MULTISPECIES: M15 family metallopeptidase [unclassified Granulicatella]MBF0779966.1 M15 family metallopeptidase [Granulicatella sp. 19428wC4_WM01]TFU95982.1 D-alanyl-D-alanine carboxypeptidase family protein [Granulicatella sp. WM01]
MMYKKLIYVIVCSGFLGACQQQESNISSSNIVTTTQESTSLASKSVLQKGEHYYFIQGKYDKIPIVNKKYPVSKDYNPGEDAVAKAALLKLQEAMRKEGFAIASGYSGFRDYNLQSYFYNKYVETDGKEKADTYSARPGYSEHQLGLVFDLWEDEQGTLLEEPVASKWLAEHAHRYGFIVRYTPGKEYSTGYQAESWHIRYIGQEAEEIYRSKLSLEEYFGVEGGNYRD